MGNTKPTFPKILSNSLCGKIDEVLILYIYTADNCCPRRDTLSNESLYVANMSPRKFYKIKGAEGRRTILSCSNIIFDKIKNTFLDHPSPSPRCGDLFLKEQLGDNLYFISRICIRSYTWTPLASSNRRHIFYPEQITRESKDDILNRFSSETPETKGHTIA
jgi:hypothetical protein